MIDDSFVMFMGAKVMKLTYVKKKKTKFNTNEV